MGHGQILKSDGPADNDIVLCQQCKDDVYPNDRSLMTRPLTTHSLDDTSLGQLLLTRYAFSSSTALRHIVI
jgi:hypothetical protein